MVMKQVKCYILSVALYGGNLFYIFMVLKLVKCYI
jgi:hypothetical protein